MHKSHHRTLSATFIGVSLALAASTGMAQSARPDLTGTWTNASLTGLTRPRGVEKLVVTPEEAQQIIANTSVAGLPIGEVDGDQIIDPETGAPPAGSFDFGLRGYNEFWIDPGWQPLCYRRRRRLRSGSHPPGRTLPGGLWQYFRPWHDGHLVQQHL